MSMAEFQCESHSPRPLRSFAVFRRAVILAAVSVALCACSQLPRSGGSKPEPSVANLSGYNHTADYIHQYYVDGQGGGNVRAYGGGGSFVCCIAYPETWREGLTATVRWTTSSSNPKATGPDAQETWHEKVVPVDRYDKAGTTINVHFLPEGEVRLIVTNMTAGAPGYPGPDAPTKPPGYPPWKTQSEK